MNWAALPRWAVALLIFFLFGFVPSVAYMLDDERDPEALQATADHFEAMYPSGVSK